MTNRETLAVEISPELKRLVDADERYNREVVETALWREFGGHRKGALEARIEEQENRVTMISNEIDTRHDELEREQRKLESLRDKYENKVSNQDAVLAEAEEVLHPEQLDPENTAVMKWADKAELSPEQFIKKMRDRLEDS